MADSKKGGGTKKYGRAARSNSHAQYNRINPQAGRKASHHLSPLQQAARVANAKRKDTPRARYIKRGTIVPA